MRESRLVASIAILLLLTGSAAAQDAAKIFEDTCAPCHAIGGPPGAAPDLKDVTKRRDHSWLVRFVLDPNAAAKVDADAAALVKEFDGLMPPAEGATPETAEALLRYIEGVSGGGAAPAPAAAEVTRASTAVDVATGHDFYEGRRALTRGGPSCVSCHRVESLRGLGGGTLGPDLTGAHRRLGGTRGLTTWLGNPPTRVMRAVFHERPLGEDESFAIASMLEDAGGRDPAAARSRTPAFAAAGAMGTLAALFAMGIVWSRRMRAVRRPLVNLERQRAGGDR